ncbi:MAG TPA: META domain-containing protein [Longimicrobiaceae bacterium]
MMRGTRTGCVLLAALTFAAGCSTYGTAGREPVAEAPASGTISGHPLENTEWVLVELGGQPARAAGTNRAPTLRLDAAQKRAAGDAGCNTFSGGYELSGQTLRFGTLASTRRACADEELTRQEGAFLRALADTRTWRVAGNVLVLSGEAGTLARFEARLLN